WANIRNHFQKHIDEFDKFLARKQPPAGRTNQPVVPPPEKVVAPNTGALTRPQIIEQADSVLAPLKQLPDVKDVGFRGSLARGTKGAHKGNAPFYPTDYDVEAFIVSDAIAGKVPKDAKGFRNLGRLPDYQKLIKSISDKLR